MYIKKKIGGKKLSDKINIIEQFVSDSNMVGWRTAVAVFVAPFHGGSRSLYNIMITEKTSPNKDKITIKCTAMSSDSKIIFSLKTLVYTADHEKDLKEICNSRIDELANKGMRAIILDSDFGEIVTRYEGILNKRYVFRSISKGIIEANLNADTYSIDIATMYKNIINDFNSRTKKILDEISGTKPSIKNLWGLLK